MTDLPDFSEIWRRKLNVIEILREWFWWLNFVFNFLPHFIGKLVLCPFWKFVTGSVLHRELYQWVTICAGSLKPSCI